MNAKSLPGILLLLHVLVHPVVHGWPAAPPGATALEPLWPEPAAAVESTSLGPCLNCRTGSSLVGALTSFVPLGVSPDWAKLAPSEPSRKLASIPLALSVRAPPLA